MSADLIDLTAHHRRLRARCALRYLASAVREAEAAGEPWDVVLELLHAADAIVARERTA